MKKKFLSIKREREKILKLREELKEKEKNISESYSEILKEFENNEGDKINLLNDIKQIYFEKINITEQILLLTCKLLTEESIKDAQLIKKIKNHLGIIEDKNETPHLNNTELRDYLLYKLYINHGVSIEELSNILNISEETIKRNIKYRKGHGFKYYNL